MVLKSKSLQLVFNILRKLRTIHLFTSTSIIISKTIQFLYSFKIMNVFRAKKWDKEMTDLEINSGVTVQHYGHTVIMLVESKLRGFTCGLCGNFNCENSDESNETPKCIQL